MRRFFQVRVTWVGTFPWRLSVTTGVSTGHVRTSVDDEHLSYAVNVSACKSNHSGTRDLGVTEMKH